MSPNQLIAHRRPTFTLVRDLAYVFVAAVLGGLVARRLRQPLVIGYVLGGIIIGPFIAGPSVSEIQVFELIAEIGVILLMYSIGVEFSVRDLLQVRWVSLVGGPLGILAVIGLALGGGSPMGWSTLQSVSIGAVVSLSSTVVLTRVLTDRAELHSEQGRVMVGITLVNDLVFVVMTVLLPSLGSMSSSWPLEVGLAFGKALAILVPVAIVAAKVIPPLMARVPRTENQDLRVLVALGLGFATTAATHALGLPLEAGAFLAGMIVSESNVARETLTDLLPLRNSLTALFFVTIGALIDLKALLSNPHLLEMLVLLIVVRKFLIWTVVV